MADLNTPLEVQVANLIYQEVPATTTCPKCEYEFEPIDDVIDHTPWSANKGKITKEWKGLANSIIDLVKEHIQANLQQEVNK